MPGMLRFGERCVREGTSQEIGEYVGSLLPNDGKVDWWGEKPIPTNTHDCMVGDRGSDMGAGWACGLRLFQTDEKKGIGAVIERILDSKDSGDSFNPVR